MTRSQLKALELLGEHGTAHVTTTTAVRSGELSIHVGSALALVRHGLAERADTGLVITQEGMRRVGLIHETPAERRQRKAAEALEAQRRGEWRPAPAGAGAAADRAAADERRHWAELIEAINSNRENARFEREMIEIAKEWNGAHAEIDEYRRAAEGFETAATEAEAELAELRRRRKGAVA